MYKLGEQFRNNNVGQLVTFEEAIFRNSTYRISILTERLIRLEYSSDGMFNNYETSIVKNRRFSVPEFTKEEDDTRLIIHTRYFHLTYFKNTPFSHNTLFAKNDAQKIIWYYGQKEVKNFNSTSVSLDSNNPMEKGLFTLDGIVTINDTNTFRFDEERNVVVGKTNKEYVDLYLFIYGNDFGLCLKDYFELTGYPRMIPRYALGNWWSKECAYNERKVIEKINSFNIHGVPLSVFLLDNGWSKLDSKYPNIKNGFSFNKDLYPSGAGFVNKVHETGVKLGLKINPQYGFYPMEDNFSLAAKYLPVNKNGYISFNPYDYKNLDVLFKVFINPLTNMGIDFYWNDYYDTDKNKIFFLNYMLNHNLSINNKRNIILARNGTYDAHLYNVLYSGKIKVDWESLKRIPLYTSNSANIGVCFWSHDIGGSVGGIEESDLYLRSIQLGVFSPILRFNTEKGNYFKREPWKWDVVTSTIATDFLKLRHQLIPYIYSEAYRYHKEGNLLIKPLYYYNIKLFDDVNYVNQYYFGDAFMISPIVNRLDEVFNRTIQKIYMPEGVWYDFKTGKRFAGNHKYISFYTIDDYPIFVKQGSIIPMAGKNSYMSYNVPKDLEIHVFPGKSNTYHLYEDDGETYEYLNGKYCITEIDYNYRKSNYTLIIRAIEGDTSVIPETRDYRIVFRNTKKSENVVVYENNTVLNNIETETTETSFVVNIKNVNSKSQLVINCYGEDIEIDSAKLIKDDIDSILLDLKINTVLKDEIASIVFSEDLTLSKKRIAIRKLKRKGLDPRSIKAFLRLLEYMEM